jgi:pimeloyl-ACP methyl ester carboxylesterase
MDEIDVAGLRIAYERVGRGPPLLLLHGFVGDARSTWPHQLDHLSDEYTVIAWDSPGAGASADPPDSFRMLDFPACLAGFVDALGLDRAHFAGLSFGGVVALAFTSRHGAVVTSLTLAGAYAGWAGSLAADVVEQRLAACLRAANLDPGAFADAMVPSMFSATVSPHHVETFAESVSRFHPSGFRTMAIASAESDLREALATIDVPVLLLYGNEDARAPLPVATALHAALPDSELVVLSGVGHVSCVEAPERFTAELRRFLHGSRIPGRPSGG